MSTVYDRLSETLSSLRSLPDDWLCSLSGAGPIAALEQKFREFLVAPHVLAVSSGTAALHTALWACGVKSGDEVILSGYDWGAATAAVLAVGAIPVYADIDPRIYTLDPEAAADACSGKTTAIIATHLFGHPAALEPLSSLARVRALCLIEDCAQAWGAEYHGRPVGTWGDAAAFSLGWGKALNAGEGGIVVLRDPRHYERALQSSQHPIRQVTEGLEAYPFGLNYRMHGIAALVALVQWADAENRLRQRTESADSISSLLAESSVLLPPYVAANCRHTFHRYCPELIPTGGVSHERVVKELRDFDIPVSDSVIGRPTFELAAIARIHHRVAGGKVVQARCRREFAIDLEHMVGLDRLQAALERLNSLRASSSVTT